MAAASAPATAARADRGEGAFNCGDGGAEQPTAAGRVFNVGAGSRTSVSEMIRPVGELADRPLDIPHRERARGDVRDTGADGARARVELGFEPTTPFRDGNAAQFDWMRR